MTLLQIQEALNQRITENPLKYFWPHQKNCDGTQCTTCSLTYETYDAKEYTINGCPQSLYMNSKADVKSFFGSNRCLGGETEIFDPVLGQNKRVDEIDSDFHVLSWNGNDFVVAQAEKPFKKDIDDIYEVELSNGNKFTCSLNHVVLTSSGYRTISDVLLAYGHDLQESNLEFSQKVRVLDVQSSLKTALSSQSDCPSCLHLHGEQLLMGEGIDQDAFPLQDDAQERISCGVFVHKDDSRSREDSIHPCQQSDLRSSLDDQPQSEDRFFDILCDTSCKPLQFQCCERKVLSQSKTESFPVQSINESVQSGNHFCSTNPCNTSYSVIVNIARIRVDVKWDFTVPKYNNYLASGVIHHNSGKTTANSVLVGFFTTGEYPEWYTGRKWNRPTKGRIFVKNFDNPCKVVTDKIHEWLPKDCMVCPPKKNNQGAEVLWLIKHKDGGVSTFDIMTYEQKTDAAEGSDQDWIMFDEPPPRSLYIAATRGLVDRDGLVLFGLTPLKEPWLFDEIYNSKDIHTESFICDMRHNLERVNPLSGKKIGLREDSIRKFEQKLTEEERETRMHGKFRYLAGRIWKEWDREIHAYDRDMWVAGKDNVKVDGQPPSHWPRALLIDPHDRMPFALLWVACSETDEYYAYREAWLADYIIEDVVEHIKKVELEAGERVQYRIIDPNFGPKRYGNSGLTVRDEFEEAGRKLQYPIRFAFGDDRKAVGRKAFARLLMYDKSKPISLLNHPSFYAAKDMKEFIYQIEHYVWDEYRTNVERDPAEKPKDLNTHFPDLAHYLSLSKFGWTKPIIKESVGSYY